MTCRSQKTLNNSLVHSTASTLPEIEVCSKTIIKNTNKNKQLRKEKVYHASPAKNLIIASLRLV